MTGPARILRRWRILLAMAVAAVVGELIGMQRLSIGPYEIVLLPLLFAFFAGVLLNPNILKVLQSLIPPDEAQAATRGLAIAVMPLVALLSVYIGPQFEQVASVGPALVLQEFGNLGTMLISMPLAVLAFGMGREAIGATFSIAREGGLAFIFGRYGGGSAEGTGVMGIYICGTVFGVIFFSLLPSLVVSLDIFDYRALAMACGTGSASMTGACSATLIGVYPAHESEIAALSASSNLMTGLTGLFVTIFVTLPLAERYYRTLGGEEAS